MKKFIVIIFVMLSLAFNAGAEESGSDKIVTVVLESHPYDNGYPNKRHRSAMRIDVHAYYNVSTNSVKVVYDGEAEGEVFLYDGDTVVGYDSAINTTLQLPDVPGQYRIEIIGETWTATGYIQK